MSLLQDSMVQDRSATAPATRNLVCNLCMLAETNLSNNYLPPAILAGEFPSVPHRNWSGRLLSPCLHHQYEKDFGSILVEKNLACCKVD